MNDSTDRPAATPAPSEIAPEETLGRSVFSRKKSDRARQGRIDYNVFLEKEAAESISVDRMKHAPIRELAAWSRARGEKRTPPRSFYGWAVLKAANAGRNGRTVIATPQPENPCHADIVLNLTGDERRRQQKLHANELAAHAKWMEAEPLRETTGG